MEGEHEAPAGVRAGAEAEPQPGGSRGGAPRPNGRMKRTYCEFPV